MFRPSHFLTPLAVGGQFTVPWVDAEGALADLLDSMMGNCFQFAEDGLDLPSEAYLQRTT